jgi:hypothetical protein
MGDADRPPPSPDEPAGSVVVGLRDFRGFAVDRTARPHCWAWQELPARISGSSQLLLADDVDDFERHHDLAGLVDDLDV